MKKKTEKKIFKIGDPNPVHPEKKLMNRRDFISSGLIGFSGMVMAPSIVSLILRERAVRAGDVSPNVSGSAMPGLCPLLIIDCAGGFGLLGNWVGSQTSGSFSPLSAYPGTGLGTLVGGIDSSMGAPMAQGVSQIYQSLMNITAVDASNPATVTQNAVDTEFVAALQAGLRMSLIHANTLSDSSSNEIQIAGMASYFGASGSRLPNGLGTVASPSAGNSLSAAGLLMPSSCKPVAISSVKTLTEALSYGPALASVPTAVVGDLAEGLLDLSNTQLSMLGAMKQGDAMSALINSGFKMNKNYVSPSGSMDARFDADCQAIYGISPANAENDSMVLEATIVKNALEGASGPGVITVGGCDYHDGTQTSGDAKDAQIGMVMKRMIQLARKKNRKFALQILTDGGIYTDPMTRNWRGDDNGHSGMVMAAFDPNGKAVDVIKTHVGNLTTGETTDPNCVTYNMQNAAQACVLNYLAMNNALSLYTGPSANALGSALVAASMIDSLVGLGPFKS